MGCVIGGGRFSCLALPHGLALTDSGCSLWEKLKRRPRRQRRGAPPSPTSSTSSSNDGEAAAAAPLPSAVQPSEAQPAAPPPRSPGAPLQVVFVAPSPTANRAAATATPDALASAEEALLSRPASLGSCDAPRAKHPCSDTTPTRTTRRATALVATLEAKGSTRTPRRQQRQLQRPLTLTAERAVARRVLILPHSRYACPQHRRVVPPVGRGMGRHDDAEGRFDAVSML